jgi:adenosylcobinamide amidohydrolase
VGYEPLSVAAAVTLFNNPWSHITRAGRYLVAALKRPHRVLSTSQVNGGLCEHVTHLVNHQSCEGAAHRERLDAIVAMGQIAYHHQVCQELGLNPQTTATMGTAANMQYAATVSAEYEEFSVTAIVTAGVQGNAGRAGDPSQYVERTGRYEPVIDTQSGTINTMLLFNVALSHAALTRAVVTMTEAKTAALQELAVSSRVSAELATGTGTDQFTLASPLLDPVVITWTGQHAKIGELIGRAVHDATREALRWQNGLEISLTRNAIYALERFGFSEAFFEQRLRESVPAQRYEFYKKNWDAILHDPQLAGCAYAIAAVLDRLAYGTLPPACAKELLFNQCCLLATTLAVKPGAFTDMHQHLQPHTGKTANELICQAILLGWEAKWHSLMS